MLKYYYIIFFLCFFLNPTKLVSNKLFHRALKQIFWAYWIVINISNPQKYLDTVKNRLNAALNTDNKSVKVL